MSLSELYAVFPSKTAILAAFLARIDEQALSGRQESTGTIRDRLFDLIMRRLDALGPYKAAVKSMVTAGPGEAIGALCLAPRFLTSMRWLAEAGGVRTSGLLGIVRVKSIAAIYLATLRTWLQDDGDDNSKTMAFLDRALRRAGDDGAQHARRRAQSGRRRLTLLHRGSDTRRREAPALIRTDRKWPKPPIPSQISTSAR